MKKIIYASIFILAIMLHCCDKSENEYIWAAYHTIQCEPLWDDNIECDSTEECVKLYFADNGIELIDIEIKVLDVAVPAACGYASGIIIHVQIEEEYSRKIKKLGFAIQ